MKRWVLKRNKVDLKKMGDALNISDITACVMANRGIGTYNDAINFINCDLDALSDISSMKDVKKSFDIISEKIKSGKKIAVYGDYDVDGVMSTVILYNGIKECGGNVIYYTPDRQKEGYGLNIDAINKLYENGVDTIFTCDNGIAAFDEIKLAKELGMTVVVLDHHEPAFDENRKDILPCTDAIIDPKQKDCEYKFKKMCAGGLAYRFIMYLFEHMNIETKKADEYITFAGIATICDIVDLLSENRIIAKNALNIINNTKNKGLKALIHICDLVDKKINEYHIGFIIGPCINATGRLENAKLSVELFIEEDIEKAYDLAKKLVYLNSERKDLTIKAAEEAIEYIENTSLKNDNVLVVYNEEIHESVAGIVAGRIKERFYKPVIVITNTEDENIAKGSGRSIESYNIFEELLKCKELFIKFGGHPMAAGLSLKKENIDLLRNMLNENSTLTEKDLTPVIKIEKQLDIDDINMNIAEELNILAPFGKENTAPLFGSKKVLVEKIYLIGKEKNIIKFMFKTGAFGERINGISFDCFEDFVKQTKHLYGDEICDRILSGNRADIYLDIIYSIGINEYNGKKSVQINVKDLRYSI